MFETLLLIIFCHLVGDYVLQNDFIAKNKRNELVSSIRTLCVIRFTVLCSVRFNMATWIDICGTYDCRSVESQIQQNKLHYRPGAALYCSSGLFNLEERRIT